MSAFHYGSSIHALSRAFQGFPEVIYEYPPWWEKKNTQAVAKIISVPSVVVLEFLRTLFRKYWMCNDVATTKPMSVKYPMQDFLIYLHQMPLLQGLVDNITKDKRQVR